MLRSFGRVLLVKEAGGRDYWACKIVGKKRVRGNFDIGLESLLTCFSGSVPPRTRRAAGLLDADWCLRSDGMPIPRDEGDRDETS